MSDAVSIAPENSLVAMLVDAIERELEPLYGSCTSDFLGPCMVALSRGEVLVGRVPVYDLPLLQRPLAVAYHDGRLTIDGVLMICDISSRFLAPGLDHHRGMTWRLPLVLPASDSYDVALAWYALIGWQTAAMTARCAEGCPDCHGSGLVPIEHCGRGTLATTCSCLDVEVPDEVLDREPWDFGAVVERLPHEELALAMEEPGTWYVTQRIEEARAA